MMTTNQVAARQDRPIQPRSSETVLIRPKWPCSQHGGSSTQTDIDRPAKKEWQPPVKHPRSKCWSAYVANSATPGLQQGPGIDDLETDCA